MQKEYYARDSYRELKKAVLNNKRILRGREFFGRTFHIKAGFGEEVVTADEIVSTLDRLIMDEERHARLAKDCLATFIALKKK